MNQPQEAAVLIASAMFMVVLISACTVPTARQVAVPDTAEIRKTIEALYEQNANAYQKHDFEAIMALRTTDFHAVLPDGTMRDRAAMENYIQGFLNGVKKWNRLGAKSRQLAAVAGGPASQSAAAGRWKARMM